MNSKKIVDQRTNGLMISFGIVKAQVNHAQTPTITIAQPTMVQYSVHAKMHSGNGSFLTRLAGTRLGTDRKQRNNILLDLLKKS